MSSLCTQARTLSPTLLGKNMHPGYISVVEFRLHADQQFVSNLQTPINPYIITAIVRMEAVSTLPLMLL